MIALLWHRFVLKHRPRVIRVEDPDSWAIIRVVQCSCRTRAWKI